MLYITQNIQEPIKMGVVTIKQLKTMSDDHQSFSKTVILLDMFLWCYFTPMVIMGSCAKWLIWVLKNSKIEKKNLGFGFNERPLKLNNNCIKSNQFCKLLS